MLVERPLQQRASPRCVRAQLLQHLIASLASLVESTAGGEHAHRLVEQLLREAERGAHGGDAGAPSLHLHPSSLNHGRML